MSLCLSKVPPITSPFVQHMMANLSPFSFMLQYPSLPVNPSCWLLSLPTLAFWSPITSKTSCQSVFVWPHNRHLSLLHRLWLNSTCYLYLINSMCFQQC
jgi:hypothetical protein